MRFVHHSQPRTRNLPLQPSRTVLVVQKNNHRCGVGSMLPLHVSQGTDELEASQRVLTVQLTLSGIQRPHHACSPEGPHRTHRLLPSRVNAEAHIYHQATCRPSDHEHHAPSVAWWRGSHPTHSFLAQLLPRHQACQPYALDPPPSPRLFVYRTRPSYNNELYIYCIIRVFCAASASRRTHTVGGCLQSFYHSNGSVTS